MGWGTTVAKQSGGVVKAAAPAGNDLFSRIGDFLARNRLAPDPVNYEFAYRVENNPTGPLAAAVNALVDGGVRLTRKDIEALGGDVVVARPLDREASAEPTAAGETTDEREAMVARTQMQVESFVDLMRSMHAETRGFGQELAASANAMVTAQAAMETAEIVRITNLMIERIRLAETRLDNATREASDLRKKLEEARDNARRDPLTGLPNRRAFEEAYDEHESAGARMFVAVCDIDKFKSVNDQFGHAVGDRVLKAIGSLIAEHCADHLVARYGGEEFVVLFTNCDRAEAHRRLENARQVVAQKRYRLRETDAPLGAVTFSAGLTDIRSGEGLSDAFERADSLLYAAKEDGRNNIKID